MYPENSISIKNNFNYTNGNENTFFVLPSKLKITKHNKNQSINK